MNNKEPILIELETISNLLKTLAIPDSIYQNTKGCNKSVRWFLEKYAGHKMNVSNLKERLMEIKADSVTNDSELHNDLCIKTIDLFDSLITNNTINPTLSMYKNILNIIWDKISVYKPAYNSFPTLEILNKFIISSDDIRVEDKNELVMTNLHRTLLLFDDIDFNTMRATTNVGFIRTQIGNLTLGVRKLGLNKIDTEYFRNSDEFMKTFVGLSEYMIPNAKGGIIAETKTKLAFTFLKKGMVNLDYTDENIAPGTLFNRVFTYMCETNKLGTVLEIVNNEDNNINIEKLNKLKEISLNFVSCQTTLISTGYFSKLDEKIKQLQK